MLSLARILPLRFPRIDYLLRGWAVVWLLALPLFHIHPETHPHHGETGHVHAVAVHTVFSGDLEGEFGQPREASPSGATSETALSFSTQGPHAWTTDPELSFSLLNDATDRKPIKPPSTPFVLLAHHVVPAPLPCDHHGEEQCSPAHLTPSLVDIPARAPPSLAVS